MKKNTPRFSKQSVEFLKKAERQKNPTWLDRNREEYEQVLLAPLQHLAQYLKGALSREATGYNFPQKGLGRLKRSAQWVEENDGKLFRGWIHYSAARPRTSRFEHNPNLYFMIDSTDPDDTVLVAGGLYMPSSRQLKKIREAIAEDASAFDRLFADKNFARHFPGGFSKDRSAKRPTRGFDPNHPRMDWLKLQAFFVWRSYKAKEYTSAQFAQIVEQDFRQILRLNELLDKAVQGQLPKSTPKKAKSADLWERLEHVGENRRQMDF